MPRRPSGSRGILKREGIEKRGQVTAGTTRAGGNLRRVPVEEVVRIVGMVQV